MSLALKDLAIKYALENNWPKACEANLKLLVEEPENVDTLNRLAFSYMKLGKFKKAKSMYIKVKDFDKTNPIAIKNLKKLETISKQKGADNSIPTVTHMRDVFIEEAGKTKTTDLKNVAEKRSLSLLQPGDDVTLAVKRSKIFVQTTDKKYIGMLPDNIGMRLVSFIKGGNEYQACIKALSEKSVTVFIKETKRMAKYKNQPSFISTPFVFAQEEKA